MKNKDGYTPCPGKEAAKFVENAERMMLKLSHDEARLQVGHIPVPYTCMAMKIDKGAKELLKLSEILLTDFCYGSNGAKWLQSVL